MRVFLRNARIGLYYAGRKHWVGKLEGAADLGTIESAAELSRDENFEQMEIFVDDGDPSCQLVIPVKPRRVRGQPHGERAAVKRRAAVGRSHCQRRGACGAADRQPSAGGSG